MVQDAEKLRDRAEQITDLIKTEELDALIVSHDDEYLLEELTPDCRRLEYLTGFTGSSGTAVVSSKPVRKATSVSVRGAGFELHASGALFVDGRYTLQAREQTDQDTFDCYDISAVQPTDWLKAALAPGARVGIDTRCISYSSFKKLRTTLEESDLELISTSDLREDERSNLVDRIWADKPERPVSLVEIFADEFNGQPSPQKRRELARMLRDVGADATVIGDPAQICWLLNIRGKDREYLPIVNCRMIAYANEALEWYISDKHLKDDQMQNLEDHFGHVDIFPAMRFYDALQRLNSSSSTVYLDPDTVNAYAGLILEQGGAEVIEGLGLLTRLKAVKNQIEIAGMFDAHVKDGMAMCRFLCWLDGVTWAGQQQEHESYLSRVKGISENTMAQAAEYCRRRYASGFRCLSFHTISALGPNAAMCHYDYETMSVSRSLGADMLYLIDSGAHYQNGTTDITRTVLVGNEVTEAAREFYTLVLRAHISFASMVFPPGTTGMQIDAIARRPLWDHGLSYQHGTGHGVGHVLSVHEDPPRVSSGGSAEPLEPGMILSDEPGYYKQGELGIRLENLLVVQKCHRPGLTHMLCFEPLTLVPFDLRLIVPELLSEAQRQWLDDYHQHVRYSITGYGKGRMAQELMAADQASQGGQDKENPAEQLKSDEIVPEISWAEFEKWLNRATLSLAEFYHDGDPA